MFIVYSGKRGTGKTYHAVLEIKKALEQNRNVFVNFTVDFRKEFPDLPHQNCKYFDTLNDMAYMRDCLMVFDEAHSDLSSRNWQTLPKETSQYMSLSRHTHVDVLFISQDISKLDKHARDITEFCVEHHVLGGQYNHKKQKYSKTLFFWTSKFLPKEIDKARRISFGNQFFRFDNKIANCYNTDELFGSLLKQLPPKIFLPSYEPRI